MELWRQELILSQFLRHIKIYSPRYEVKWALLLVSDTPDTCPPERFGPFQLKLQGHLVHLVFLFLFGGDEFGFVVTLLGLQLPLWVRRKDGISTPTSAADARRSVCTDNHPFLWASPEKKTKNILDLVAARVKVKACWNDIAGGPARAVGQHKRWLLAASIPQKTLSRPLAQCKSHLWEEMIQWVTKILSGK